MLIKYPYVIFFDIMTVDDYDDTIHFRLLIWAVFNANLGLIDALYFLTPDR